MMPPVPVTNATSQSATCACRAAAHHLTRGVDDVVHAAGHARLPERQLPARGVEREVAAEGQVVVVEPRLPLRPWRRTRRPPGVISTVIV